MIRRVDGMPSAIIGCLTCGGAIRLDEGYTIDDRGLVDPDPECKPCGPSLGLARLDGW